MEEADGVGAIAVDDEHVGDGGLVLQRDFAERRHEVAVAQVALMDVAVGGAVDEQLAGDLPIGAAGGGRSAPRNHLLTRFSICVDDEPAARLPSVVPWYLALAMLAFTTSLGELPDVVDRAEQRCVARDGAEIGQLGASTTLPSSALRSRLIMSLRSMRPSV